jgi:hypothetical protein
MKEVQLVMDVVTDERAWCMFASAILSQGVTPFDASKAASAADALLKEFHARFRSDDDEGPEAADEDEDEDEDD